MNLSNLKTKLYNKQDINQLATRLSSSNAMLFIGAGFSKSSKNIFDKELPLAGDLADEIGKLGNFNGDKDLPFSADKYLEKYNPDNLIKLLEKLYTISKVSDEAKAIINLDYRRIYTTNYDNLIEQAAIENKHFIKSIDIEDEPMEHYKNNKICVHINGSIKNLNLNTINTTFKLSESSYLLNSDSFIDSDWMYAFKKDLESASAIIFLGYSLYDIDIKKILYADSFLKEKTYFITSENPSEKKISKFKKFGKIIDIGIDGFASLINQHVSAKSNDIQNLNVFEEYKPNANLVNADIRDIDIYNLLTRGVLDKEKAELSLSDNNAYTYIIKREECNKVLSKLNENERLISITAEFGNGKTILLNELSNILYVAGYQVFELIDFDLDFTSDFEIFKKSDKKSVLLIDRYADCLDLIKYAQILNINNFSLIVFDRPSNHAHAKKTLGDSFNPFEVNLDLLTENEITDFISLIGHIGEWGEIAGNEYLIREKFNKDYKNQLSLALLSLFKSSQIKNSLDSLVYPLVKDEAMKKTVLSIFLLNLIDVPTSRILISEMSQSNLIMHAEIFKNKNFQELFIANDSMNIKTKSSLLSKFIIREYFTYTALQKYLIEIVERSVNLRKNDKVWGKIQRELLRFHSVEQMVADTHKKIFLKNYFENLKKHPKMRWLEKEPHYWLQYAMADIANEEFEKAQVKLDTAYSHAENKSNYDTSSFDNQQARLYILKAMNKSIRGDQAYSLFLDADKLLSLILNTRFDAKQISTYKKFYDKKFKVLSKENKKAFLEIILQRHKHLLELKHEQRDMYISTPEYYRCESNLLFILEQENCLP
jgi:hypothetical protein